jgi:glutathione synthase/RimK-type ligase-like ATP-grasp enzyme
LAGRRLRTSSRLIYLCILRTRKRQRRTNLAAGGLSVRCQLPTMEDRLSLSAASAFAGAF